MGPAVKEPRQKVVGWSPRGPEVKSYQVPAAWGDGEVRAGWLRNP